MKKKYCIFTKRFLLYNFSFFFSENVNDFDAIIFHPRDMEPEPDGYLRIPRQKIRKPHQYYVMFMVESAIHDNHFPYKKFPGLFNWTMTFRKDSDLYR